MSIKLEDFIKAHKREFDTDVPSAKLWDKIDGQLAKKKQKKTINIRLWMSIAAAVIVVLSVTLIYMLPGREKEMNMAGINPGYEKKQLRFAGLIEEKRDSLQIFAQANPELYNKFSADLGKLEQAYAQLKKELPGSPNRQLVVRAMVKNLEIQLQVVSQQLSIINEVDQSRKENSI
jgi:hypothetical protein